MQFKNIIKNDKTRMFKDFTLNIIASIILTIATQIIAYPFLSRIMSIEEYGLLLTIMGIVNAVGVALGNPLNNARILLQHRYEKENLNGDFNIIFMVCALIGAFTVTVLSIIVSKRFDIVIIGCVIISLLILFRSYYSASYRIIINYKKNLLASLWGFAGYGVGICITYFTHLWIFTFIFGELFSCIYIYFTAVIIHDKIRITSLFRTSFNKYIFIMLAAILVTAATYMDRFFIYPILGAEKVAVFNVASFLGKTAGIVMIPITSVLLTYYAKEKNLTLSQFYKRTGLFFITALLFYLAILCFGVPITRILYPTLANESIPFFAIANLATTVFILGNTLQPTLLRYCDVKWQPIIQVVYFGLYLVVGYLGMIYNGLSGFCYSILIVNVIKIVIMLCIATFSLYRQEKEGENEHAKN
ncbi:MAG: lipopolysaccharide biosynthesis protein [Saccharofermentanales bacterium]